MARPLKLMVMVMAILLVFLAVEKTAYAISVPTIKIGLEEADSPQKTSVLLQIILLLTVLSLAPSILLMMTCFTRVAVVLSFLRHAIGTQQSPPNQIVIGLSLFLTFFIMAPVWQNVNEQAIKPYMEEQITQDQALDQALVPVREFMFKQTREKDLSLFVDIAKVERPQNKDDIPTMVLIPAFMISELKTAFQIGFILYIPFLIIDMVVASVLLSMGMMMLPPVMISLPFKLLLFVLVDGWYLVVGSLVKSFV